MDTLVQLLPIDGVLIAVGLWMVIGAAGIARPASFFLVARVLFPLGAVVSLLVAGMAVVALSSVPQVAILPLGLPGLPFHLRLDALSAFFLLLLGGTGVGIGLFAAGYFRKGEGTPPGVLCLLYHLFLASMAMVLLSDDAYVFMVMWEAMALSSFFLVTANHVIPAIRRAGYLYLLIAHVGAIAILLAFGVLQANTGDYTFANMRAQQLSPFWASIAFLLALFGFGAKAGIVPLHVWLPEAHPAAPSPVSALMSGVMLKTAIYGLLRVGFEILQTQLWWWGVLVLVLGLVTALFGVVFARVQTDMKRLLAYSSIENIGLLMVGIGLALLFLGYGTSALAALALTAVLYHALNHAFFKSLLFLGTGSVLHATGERNLGKLGGLLRYMPWVGWLALVGALASGGTAAAERLRLRVAAAAELPVHSRTAEHLRQHAAAGGRRRRRARGGAGRLRDGEVLRRDLPRPAARAGAGAGRTTPARIERAGPALARGRLRAAGPVSRHGDRPASTR